MLYPTRLMLVEHCYDQLKIIFNQLEDEKVIATKA